MLYSVGPWLGEVWVADEVSSGLWSRRPISIKTSRIGDGSSFAPCWLSVRWSGPHCYIEQRCPAVLRAEASFADAVFSLAVLDSLCPSTALVH